MANVLLPVVLGLDGVVVLCWQWRRNPKIALLVGTALLGGFLLVKCAVTENRGALWAHIALGVAGLAMLLPGRWRAGLAVLTLAAGALRFGRPADRIRNPETVLVSMAEEGAGPKSPFWPSSAKTNTGGCGVPWTDRPSPTARRSLTRGCPPSCTEIWAAAGSRT